MFRGLYTATSGMMANNRKQQILTNNLANMNTPGFKQDQSVSRAFPEQLIKALNVNKTVLNRNGVKDSIGTLNTGVYVQEGVPSFLQGALKETGKNTDLALIDEYLPINPENGQRGSLVFAVRLENGELRYTRNGQFSIGQDGLLKTSDGYNVLNENLQPIQITSDQFTVSDRGQITLNDGTLSDQIWIGYTEKPHQFVKEGNSLLRWDGPGNEAPVNILGIDALIGTSVVQQGFIEQSNVDLTKTMTEMISTYRSFESNQKVIQAYDRSMEIAANDIGKIY